MSSPEFINRKTFLRLLAWATGAALFVVWRSLTGKQKELSERPVVFRINPSKLGAGVFLFDRFIVVKSDSLLKVYSNKCTHAGCRINQEINGELVCPCHGSRYESSTGKVLQGPAGLPLPEIPFGMDSRTGEITINI